MPQSPSPSPAPLPLDGERIAFTGTLASMTHRQAQAKVEEQGGAATEHVSRHTTMLVIGEEGWPLEADGKPSLKWQQVTKWRQEGLEICVVSESDWLGFVGLDGRRQEVHRHYTPAMLSQLLGVPVNVIRGWERSGLIRAASRVCRLPYFDFQEVAGARRLAELVAAGVSCKEIQNSLHRLQGVLPGIERPLAQLEILARDRRLIYRDDAGRLKTVSGQRLFDFDVPEPSAKPVEDAPAVLAMSPREPGERTAAEWFAEGCRLAEEGELPPAVEAFRLCLMDDEEPVGAEVHFQLAETLYRLGNLPAALERYYVAVEQDHNYLEAWTQLGCVSAELGDLEAAIGAFDVALAVHPDYPDAHLHKAESLHQLGRTPEAVTHWRRYLQFDQRGPWAAAARRRLEEAAAPK